MTDKIEMSILDAFRLIKIALNNGNIDAAKNLVQCLIDQLEKGKEKHDNLG